MLTLLYCKTIQKGSKSDIVFLRAQYINYAMTLFNHDIMFSPFQIKNLTKFKRLSGEGFVPINENAQNTATFSDSRIFAGSMMSSDAADNAFVVASAKVARPSRPL